MTRVKPATLRLGCLVAGATFCGNIVVTCCIMESNYLTFLLFNFVFRFSFIFSKITRYYEILCKHCFDMFVSCLNRQLKSVHWPCRLLPQSLVLVLSSTCHLTWSRGAAGGAVLVHDGFTHVGLCSSVGGSFMMVHYVEKPNDKKRCQV